MKIALTYTGYPVKHQYYADWLRGNDEAEIITFSTTENNADAISQCDALVLSGGIDVDPQLYHGNTTYAHQPKNGWDTPRDLFEQSLFNHAFNRRLPILGICRGLQLVNVCLQGTLQQDLGDDRLNKIHKDEADTDKQHTVNIQPNTLLHDMVKETSGEVNSAHHQAIAALGKGLMVNCLAPDGTIEGIEWIDKKDKSFLLAVQWHPERMFTHQLGQTPLSKVIRDRFIAVVKNQNHQ